MKILADHRLRECLWPLDTTRPTAWGALTSDTSQQPFCCEPVEPGSKYCACHTWDSKRNPRGPRP